MDKNTTSKPAFETPLSPRELQWAANQFGTGVTTLEAVTRQYERIYAERAAKKAGLPSDAK